MKIYVSSTFNDLEEYRRAVYSQLRKMRGDAIAMEDYAASDRRPLDQCVQDVADSDIYLGIFAWRYGYAPTEGNPDHRAITELEYRAAADHNKPRLIFLLADDAPWDQASRDTHTGAGDNGQRIRQFRDELKRDHIVAFFSTPDELAKEVAAAVHRHILDNRPKLDISDVQAIQDKDSNTCTVDFRVSNPSNVDIQINQVRFEVVAVVDVQTLGFMDFSQVYDLDISSLETKGDSISSDVSQVLKPGEADRFGIRLRAADLGEGVFRAWHLLPSMATNGGDFQGPVFEVWLPRPVRDGATLEDALDKYGSER